MTLTKTKRPLLWGWGVAMALMAPVAGAQEAATPATAEEADALTDKARQLYEEGRAAAAAGKWADAHASFLAAWAIKNHYQIASNLGVTCLKLGKPRDAAAYLTLYLREAPASKVRERQAAEASLKEALAKVASVTVQVAPAGAEVTVDGVVVGRAPLPDPVFLDPGPHELGARLDGHVPVKRQLEAKAGAAETVALQLERRPAPDAVVGAEGAMTPGPGVPPRDNVRTAVLVGGGIAAGAGVAAGVVLTVLSSGRASDAREIRSGLLADWGGEHRCPYGDQLRCAELKEAVYDKYNLRSAAIWSFVAGGAIGVGTLIYGLVTMKPEEPAPRAQVAPFLGPGAAGMSLSGRF